MTQTLTYPSYSSVNYTVPLTLVTSLRQVIASVLLLDADQHPRMAYQFPSRTAMRRAVAKLAVVLPNVETRPDTVSKDIISNMWPNDVWVGNVHVATYCEDYPFPCTTDGWVVMVFVEDLKHVLRSVP